MNRFIAILILLPASCFAGGPAVCMGYNTPLPGSSYYGTCNEWWDSNSNSVASNWTARIGTNLTLCANLTTNILNNMNVIHFNGTNSYAQTAANFTMIPQPCELVLTAKCYDPTNVTGYMIASTAAGVDSRFFHGAGNPGQWNLYGGTAFNLQGNTDTNWHAFFNILNAASSQWSIDGTNLVTASATIGTNAFNSMCIGAFHQSTGPSQNDFRDVLIFSTTNNPAQRFTLWAKFLQPRLQ